MKVQVYVYDLTRGMASALSPMFLGSRIEGVWHTGVVLDGLEEIFFGYGISRVRAGTTMFGQPHHILDIGTTEVPKEMVSDLLSELQPRFMPQHYNLLFHNCNTFSNELCQLLTGEGLPEYILNQAEVIFNTPFGESITPLVLQMEGITGRAAGTGMAAPPPPPAAAAAAGTSQPAAPSPWPAIAAAAVSSDTAAATSAAAAAANAGMEATAQAVQAVQAAELPAEQQKAAVAAAGTTAAARAARAADVAAGSSCCSSTGMSDVSVREQGGSSSAAAVGKVTEGVDALQLTADSRSTPAS